MGMGRRGHVRGRLEARSTYIRTRRASVLAEDVVERHLEELEELVDRLGPLRVRWSHELHHHVFAARRRVGAYRAHDGVEVERPARARGKWST